LVQFSKTGKEISKWPQNIPNGHKICSEIGRPNGHGFLLL
jgi:hypothetical protein